MTDLTLEKVLEAQRMIEERLRESGGHTGPVPIRVIPYYPTEPYATEFSVRRPAWRWFWRLLGRSVFIPGRELHREADPIMMKGVLVCGPRTYDVLKRRAAYRRHRPQDPAFNPYLAHGAPYHLPPT